jgi:hypothetical protein
MNEYTLTFPGYRNSEPRTFRAKDIEAARTTAQRLVDQWRFQVEARGERLVIRIVSPNGMTDYRAR